MSTETTIQDSCIQENPEVDECSENVPPGISAAAETPGLKVQVDVGQSSSAQPSGETCTFSTPAPTSGKRKSRISGLQTALTPILKYLNIGNRCPSPGPLKCGNSPHRSVTTANCQESIGGSSQRFNKDFPSNCSVPSLGDKDAPVRWLDEEYLPEITLLDVTCDSTLQNNTFDSKHSCKQNGTTMLPETSSGNIPPKLLEHNGTAAVTALNTKMVDTPGSKGGLMCWLNDIYVPEITLLDVTRDSELSPSAEISPMELTQDIPQVDNMKYNRPELSGLNVLELDRLDVIQSEELSNTHTECVTHTTSSFSDQLKCVGGNMKSSLEVTHSNSFGGVLRNNTPSFVVVSGENTGKSQMSDEDTLGLNPANVTHDISSSSDMSVQCDLPQFSNSDMQCNTSLKNVTTELHVKPMETLNIVEGHGEALCTSHENKLSGEAPQPSEKTNEPMNGTFTVDQLSNRSAPTTTNTTSDQMSCLQNKTLDLPPSNVSSLEEERKATEQKSHNSKNTTETSLMNQNNSDAKANGSCDVLNTTFDRHSLQKSNGSTNIGEAGAATFCLQSNTFDRSPHCKQNGTITLSETSLSDSQHIAMTKPSPSKGCNPTTIHTETPHDLHVLSKQNETTTITDANTKMVENTTTENTFEANPAVEAASGSGGHETKNHSRSVIDGLSDTLGHRGRDGENNKENTFNLDDTLDLKADPLVTSTPMLHCKMFYFTTDRDEGKITGAQRRLNGNGPSKTAGQVPSDVPSNIISDRKTFLTQPAAKSLLPPVKAASQLLKYKPTTTLPGRCEPVTSSLPMTRQRAQAEALKNASEAAHQTTGISGCYNLRATTTESKQPNSGLLRPQLSGIPCGIQRTATGLRLPSARGSAPSSSSTNKHHGATAINPVTKTAQPKKHPLTRGEPLPTAKRKKIDAPLPFSGADSVTSSSETVNRAKTLKPPANIPRALLTKTQKDVAAVSASTAENSTSCNTVGRARAHKQPANSHRAQLIKTQGHGCAKCVLLEEQLKIKSEENRKLKEELLKYSKQEDGC